jgi:Family of unknown function (DUF6502)
MADTAPEPPPDTSPEQQALQAALAGLMASVARLAVARGLPYAPVEALLRQAFVQAAAAAHPGLPEHRKVSRISTTTGINRREVTRLVGEAARAGDGATQTAPASPAGQVFAHWRTQAAWCDAAGQPLTLPRLGPRPSFEALVQEVTRTVHARSLLDELCRLGIAHWDEAADTVALQTDRFLAPGDASRQLGFLGNNVGDHLRAAVDNVLAGAAGAPPSHFEQAVFAWGLGEASLAQIEPVVRDQWQALMNTLVPLLRERVAADATPADAPPLPGRIRVGLYAYQEGAQPAVAMPTPPAVARRRAVRKKPE